MAVFIYGRQGAGKSTLAQLLCGTEPVHTTCQRPEIGKPLVTGEGTEVTPQFGDLVFELVSVSRLGSGN